MDPGIAMKSGGRGMTAGRERFGLRRVLVVSQVAMSLVLVAAALLFSRSLSNLLTVDAGFNRDGVLIATVVFQRLNLSGARDQAFKQELIDRIEAIPGVESVAFANTIPLHGMGGAAVWMDGEQPEQAKGTNLSRVGWNYFKTLQISLLAGRDFDGRDRLDTPRVAIVNEAFARRYLNGANPVGHRFWVDATPNDPRTSYEIIGLVRDTKYLELREEFRSIAYYNSAQNEGAGSGGNYFIRSRLSESETAAAVKQLLNDINPAITVSFQGFKPMIEATILRERLMATLSGFFGLLALLLACVGVYGILSYGVTCRTGEIGIRMALGAEPLNVFWMILRESLWLVVAGVLVGLPIIIAVTRLAATLLYDLTPTDPVSLVCAALLMIGIAMAAGYLPSRRATRVDPIVALRDE